MASMPTVVMDLVQAEVIRLVMRPGDLLVVKCKEHLPEHFRAAIKAAIEPVLPHGCKCLVMSLGFDLVVIEKRQDVPEPDATIIASQDRVR